MIRRTVVALALLFVSMAAVAAPLTTADKRRAAESLAVLTESMFFDARRSVEIAAELRKRTAAGVFDDAATSEALAAKLTSELQKIENDGHLRVRFKPENAGSPLLTTEQLQAAVNERASGRPVMRMAPGPGEATAARRVPRAVSGGTPEDAAKKNYEISEARHLEGNVGYIRMDVFESPRLAGETFSAAMAFLQNVDALILDLRNNRGGAQPMVDYVASYFLPTDGRTLLTSRFRDMEPLVARTFEVPGKRMESTPLYILISAKTFSAGEALPYILQKFGRATIVGEKTTGGGRHNAWVEMGGGLEASISVSDVVHPVTKSSWQGTGVIPDVATTPDQALETAHRLARKAGTSGVSGAPGVPAPRMSGKA